MEKKWKILNIVIILFFVLQILYGMYQVFFALSPSSGHIGPLFGSAKDISFDLMVERRLYAIETWLAIVGLAIYLAIVYRDKLKY